MKHLSVVMALGAVLAAALPASAQDAGQGGRTTIGGAQGAQTFSVRGRLIVWGAAGLDLDVLGDVTAGSLGRIRGTPVLVDGTAYPDVYVRTQRRRYLGIGYGVFQKAELVVRYQETSNPAATVIIGQFGASSNTFPVSFDNYTDKLVEFGIRKYMASARSNRVYFMLLGGLKTVEPLGITMLAPGGNVTAELYGKSRIPSMGLEFGITFEYRRIGVFLESGMRWQKRLARNDMDLAPHALEDLNNTGIRLFMPANIGVLVRF